MVRATGVDHIVLRVADVERSVAWYHDRLGLDTDRLDEWRRGEVLFPSVRLNAGTIIDILAGEQTGTNVDHFCLTIDADALPEGGLEAVVESGDFDVLGPPAELYGARGMGRSIYVRDPDGNVVELRHY